MPVGAVTARDVAREAEVSVGTVSRVFNNHDNVAEEIRFRVLQAATQLGYSYPVQAPKYGRVLTEVGFLFSPVNPGTVAGANPFWSHVLAGVEAEARSSRIKLTYRAIDGFNHRPAALLEGIQKMRLGGLLVVGPTEPEVIETLKMLNLPLVAVESYTPGQDVDAVISDNFEGAWQATSYLIDKGHRDIAFINGPPGDGPRQACRMYTLEMRARGYRAAMAEAGVLFDLEETSDLTPGGGYAACKRILARSVPFSALFCANDSAAIGAMKALHEAGLSVPGAVSLVGYGDDTDIVGHLTPPLTTVRIDKEAVGATAVKRLLARTADPTAPWVLTVLEVALIKRESVRAYGA
jgi:DNA-binding LacI/PurR family transcriptional regulator